MRRRTTSEDRSLDALEKESEKRAALVPIRVEFETETHRIRDCFVWNLNEGLMKPEMFAKVFCSELELGLVPWAETVANQIRAQLEEHEGVGTLELGVGDEGTGTGTGTGEENAECRVILSVRARVGMQGAWILNDGCRSTSRSRRIT